MDIIDNKLAYKEFLYKCQNPKYDYKNNTYRRCGKCSYCNQLKTNEWMLRCRHELMVEPKAIFFTLTYKNNPVNLQPDDTTKFLKRLRKKFNDKKLRYIYCGEYGPKTFRPHYHFLVFGINWQDLSNNSKFESARQKFAKKTLANIWKLGHVDISYKEVTDFTVRYILGYVRKKQGYDFSQFSVKPFKRQSQGLGWSYAGKNLSWLKTGYFQYDKLKITIPRYYQRKIYESEGKKITIIDPKIDIATGRKFKQYSYKIIPDFSKPNSKLLYNTILGLMRKRIAQNGTNHFNDLLSKDEYIEWSQKLLEEFRLVKEVARSELVRYRTITRIVRTLSFVDSSQKNKNYKNKTIRVNQAFSASANQYNYLSESSPYGYRDRIDLGFEAVLKTPPKIELEGPTEPLVAMSGGVAPP